MCQMKTSVVSNEQEFTESMAEAMSKTQNKEPRVPFWPVNLAVSDQNEPKCNLAEWQWVMSISRMI